MQRPLKVRAELLKHLDRFDAISLDVFDTLLQRRIHPPELVQEASSAFVSARLRAAGVWVDAAEVQHVRKVEEARLRRESLDAGGDAECEFAPLIRATVDRCAGEALFDQVKQDLTCEVIEHELQLEREVLAPHPEMTRLYRELLARGKRVILCSDMYLSSEHIRRLLDENGIETAGVPIYVSGECKLGKGSGRLFRHWLERESIDAARAVHIGDRMGADFTAPLSVGLNAIHLADPDSRGRRRRLTSLHRRAAQNDYYKGAYVLALCDSLKRRPPRDDFFYQYGRQFLGPVFTVFVHRLVEKVRQYDIGQLLFVAREGFLLKKIHERFEARMPEQGPWPAARYAFLSRHSTALASVHHLSHREIEMGAYRVRGGLADVLQTYGLPQEPLASIAAEYGIGLDAPITPADEPQLTQFLTDSRVQAAVAPLQRAAAAKLDAYLGQCEFWGRSRKVALVDVGWEGTIQFNLLNAFGQRQDFPQLFGFYLGRRCGRNLLHYSPSYAEGLLYDFRRESVRERLLLEFFLIYELAGRAPHGTTLGYDWRERAESVRPVLKQPGRPDRDEEIRINPCLAVMQQGVLDFTERYLDAIRWNGFTAEQVKPYVLATAARFACLPRREEARMVLKGLKHSEDFGASSSLDLGVHRFRVSSRNDWLALRHAFWKQGSLSLLHRSLAWFGTACRSYLFLNW
jgi:FMN phosphatase YigB (HAD superfamily)